jgi:hypothetical protein
MPDMPDERKWDPEAEIWVDDLDEIIPEDERCECGALPVHRIENHQQDYRYDERA